MRRNFFWIIGALFVVAGLMLAGNVLVIGERLARMHPVAEYAFYLLVGILTAFFLIVPVWRVARAPGIPAFDEEALRTMPAEALVKLGISLARNNYYIREADRRKSHRDELTAFFRTHATDREAVLDKISEEMDVRLGKMDRVIREHALTVFLITGLSQNGKFDFISAMAVNFKMIGRLVATSGFRPTYARLIRIYTQVLGASFITYFSEDMLDDIDFSSVTNTVRLPGILVSSLLDGTVTALMTLRIGYITQLYIRTGNAAFNRRAARRYGLKRARKEIVEVARLGMKRLQRSTVDGFVSFWKSFVPWQRGGKKDD